MGVARLAHRLAENVPGAFFVASLDKLRAHAFEWVLPGHGRRYRAPSAAAMQRALAHTIAALR